MELDLFGIKIGGQNNNNRIESTKMVEYNIKKEDLLRKLGFQEQRVVHIYYDYRTGILTIKQKEQ